MEREPPYNFGRTVDLIFEEAVVQIKEALGRQGFGILTEIDVTGKFKEKLGLAFRPYRILGTCNPAPPEIAGEVRRLLARALAEL